jgi:hypothetical protein
MSRFSAAMAFAEDMMLQQADQNAAYQAEVSGEPTGMVPMATAGTGGLLQQSMNYFTPRNLIVFNSLLQVAGIAFDAVNNAFPNWPESVRKIWNMS